mmetsp:Transcript_27316/g.45555  ORF Transcript_27316/g.45555 Transcript_27316/m.45555 type:complete len:112 (-) Transcript_27316:729-1064(-)
MLYSAARVTALVVALGFEPATAISLGQQLKPSIRTSRIQLAQGSPVSVGAPDCGCELGEDGAGSVMMNDVRVSGSTLRSIVLTDKSGDRASVESVIGSKGKGVIVFLRHLG